MMKNYRIFIFLCIFFAVSNVNGQENTLQTNTLQDVDFDDLPASVRLPYAYPFTLEMNFGYGRNVNTYSRNIPDRALSGCADVRGFDLNLMRFTGYFSKHWGAFISIGGGFYPVNAAKTEEALENQYNGRYTYYNLVREENEDCDGIFDSKSYSGGGASTFRAMIGPAYRYDVGRWSFRARLGLGISEFYPEHARYLRVDNMYSDIRLPELVEIEFIKNKEDKERNDNTINAFTYAPSIQVNYAVCSHFFLSFEAAFIGNIGHCYERIRTYSMEESPKNGGWLSDLIYTTFFPWAPSMTPEYDGCYYKKHELLDIEYHKIHPGNFVSFNLGFGWYIGHNRNEKRMRK